MITQRIDRYDFAAAFERMNRADNFSREGLSALFDHLEVLQL